MIAGFVADIKAGKNEQVAKFENAPDFSTMSDQEIAVWYNIMSFIQIKYA